MDNKLNDISPELKNSILEIPAPPNPKTLVETLQDQICENAGIPKILLEGPMTFPLMNRNIGIPNAIETIKARAHDINKAKQFCLEVEALASKYELPFFIVSATDSKDMQSILEIRDFATQWKYKNPDNSIMLLESDSLNKMVNIIKNPIVYGNRADITYHDEFVAELSRKEEH
jgi:hypothetical protein